MYSFNIYALIALCNAANRINIASNLIKIYFFN